MQFDNNIPWKRLVAEGVAIVVSILLAFSIQAWWEFRQANQQRLSLVAALDRDFQQMAERAQASFDNADTAVQSGTELLRQLSAEKELNYESAMHLIQMIGPYEVFSPSVGAYESLLSSGGIDLLVDSSLKRELASFFGSFEDMRVSEQILVNNLTRWWQSREFTHLVGFQRLPIPGLPQFEFGEAPIEEWKDSEYLASYVSLLTLSQKDVRDDYGYLLERLDTIQEALAVEAALDR